MLIRCFNTAESDGCVVGSSILRRTQRRKNTLEEKQRMRNQRIRRKRQLRSMACDRLKSELAESRNVLKNIVKHDQICTEVWPELIGTGGITK